MFIDEENRKWWLLGGIGLAGLAFLLDRLEKAGVSLLTYEFKEPIRFLGLKHKVETTGEMVVHIVGLLAAITFGCVLASKLADDEYS